MHAISKLTARYQTTIPAPVREFLGLKKGDAIAFDIEDGRVRLTRATARDLAYARAVEGTLSEWESPDDETAYRDL